MKTYLVGGAVRDELLGLPIKERDFVVINATIEDMLKLGYKQVGKEFPVFLHPKTNEEYALARMERKVKPGYKGFIFDTSPSVTLEDDLLRRDLTINAIAKSLDDGTLIDPYHGQQDIKDKLLRHVSNAFKEDPVRILRLGRFFARFSHLGFTVAPETITLMREMVNAGEVNALVAERVWKEFERALGEKNPEKFFELLDKCHALSNLFPYFGMHLDMNNPGISALIAAAKLTDNTAIRFAALLNVLPAENDILELCNRYRVPNAYSELALLTAKHYETALKAKTLSAEEIASFFSAIDIYRREDRFHDFLLACTAIANSRNKTFDAKWLILCENNCKLLNIQDIIKNELVGNELAIAIKQKRTELIAEWLEKNR